MSPASRDDSDSALGISSLLRVSPFIISIGASLLAATWLYVLVFQKVDETSLLLRSASSQIAILKDTQEKLADQLKSTQFQLVSQIKQAQDRVALLQAEISSKSAKPIALTTTNVSQFEATGLVNIQCPDGSAMGSLRILDGQRFSYDCRVFAAKEN